MSTTNSFVAIRESHLARLAKLKKRIAWLAVARLLLFLATVAAVYFTADVPWWPLVLGVAGLAVFLYVVRLHANEKELRDHTRNALAVCDEELARQRGEWRGMDGGEAHLDPDHPYVADLGVFGQHSLYQYSNRTQSPAAAERWAGMLGENLTHPEAIAAEREYIRALAGDMNFAVTYLARARGLRAEDQNFAAVRAWSVTDRGGPATWVDLLITRVLPVYSVLATVAYALDMVSGSGFLLLLALPAITIFSALGRHQKIFGNFETVLGKMPAYEAMLSMLRRRAESNKVLAKRWGAVDLAQSEHALQKLKSIAGAMDSRNNLFVSIVLNLLLLWDFQVARRLRVWREEYADELANWLELTADVEAHLSPAVFVHNHPGFVFPKFADDFSIQLTDARHVLLGEEAVPNDLKLSGPAAFSIVTGANMAGKSTYLRTVGTCLVLAMRGLPVPASTMHFKPVKLFTGMLTADSLGEGESYFFSELKRLKMIVETLESGRPLFVILDEILKGTNSKDKAVGSKKFLEKLLSLPAKGLIATHDLSLCDIADTYPQRVENHSFEVDFRGDELHFDYKLRAGVCQNMNAAFLLRKMGLTLDS